MTASMMASLWQITVMCSLALACSLLHELGHVGMAVAAGGRVKHIGVCWRGFYVLRSRLATDRREILCSLAGPTVNLMLALLLLSDYPEWRTVGLLNLGLGLLNLVLPHSDGQRALLVARGVA